MESDHRPTLICIICFTPQPVTGLRNNGLKRKVNSQLLDPSTGDKIGKRRYLDAACVVVF